MVKIQGNSQIDFQVLGRSGHYPCFTIRTPKRIFVSSPDVVWCAVKHTPPEYFFHWAGIFTYYPEEIRLLSAIALSAGDPWDNGRFSISPWLRQEVDSSAAPPFKSKSFLTFGTGLAKRLMKSTEVADLCAFPKEGYSLGEGQGSVQAVLELLDAIDTDDELLIAGLSRYLSAQRLAMTYSFFEEASLFALLSLEAALEYIRQVLEERTQKQVSFSGVYEYLAGEFPQGNDISEWFHELYESRIMLVHPSSRLGETWTAPMFKNDCWNLVKWLVLVYRYILLGEIPEPTA